jgi:hypothetical protein
MAIFFYKVDAPYGCFSNFSPHPIELEGYFWPTSEHYYQAQKFVGTPDQHLYESIRIAPSPEAAAAIGRDQHHHPRTDWDTIKPAVMYKAVFTKFSTHPELTDILLQTGDELIIEDSSTDAYWGCGSDGAGQNQLGKILMQVRERLR